MVHDSTMLTLTLLSVCSIVCVICNDSPCQHLPLIRHRPALLSAAHHRVITRQYVSCIPSTRALQQKHRSLVCHKPLCQLSVINPIPQERTSLVLIRTLCQRLTAEPCSKPVYQVSKCLSCGQFLIGAEAFGCCASSDDSGTPSQSSRASLDERSSFCHL